jgi:hypothetical protein
MFPEVPQHRDVLVRQRHGAERDAAGESRGQSTEAISFGRRDGKLQAVEDEHRRVCGDARICRD